MALRKYPILARQLLYLNRRKSPLTPQELEDDTAIQVNRIRSCERLSESLLEDWFSILTIEALVSGPLCLDTINWATQRLCALGASPSIIRSPAFGHFLLQKDPDHNLKLTLFRTVCLDYYRTFPRPTNSCLVCDVPILSVFGSNPSRATIEIYLAAVAKYMDFSKVQQVCTFLRDAISCKVNRKRSRELKRIETNLCKRHVSWLHKWEVSFLNDLLEAFERLIHVPSLSTLTVIQVLRCCGGDRDRAVSTDITPQAKDLLKPKEFDKIITADDIYAAYPESWLVGSAHEARATMLKMFCHIVPRTYKRLCREDKA